MKNALLEVTKNKPCKTCGKPHPAACENPCNCCRNAIREGLRSADMLNMSWGRKFAEIISRFELKRTLSDHDYAVIELFKQAMLRSRNSIDLPGKPTELSEQEWATMSRQKFQQHRLGANLPMKDALLLQAFIECAK